MKIVSHTGILHEVALKVIAFKNTAASCPSATYFSLCR